MSNQAKIGQYRSEVFWSEEDEGFVAVVPELLGCNAFGESRVEAMEELQSAIESWIEAAEASGCTVPEPSVHQGYHDRSGKILIRMPRELHHTLANEAEQQGTSINQYVCYLLTREHTSKSASDAAFKDTKIYHQSNTVGLSTNQLYIIQPGVPLPEKKSIGEISTIGNISSVESM